MHVKYTKRVYRLLRLIVSTYDKRTDDDKYFKRPHYHYTHNIYIILHRIAIIYARYIQRPRSFKP